MSCESNGSRYIVRLCEYGCVDSSGVPDCAPTPATDASAATTSVGGTGGSGGVGGDSAGAGATGGLDSGGSGAGGSAGSGGTGGLGLGGSGGVGGDGTSSTGGTSFGGAGGTSSAGGTTASGGVGGAGGGYVCTAEVGGDHTHPLTIPGEDVEAGYQSEPYLLEEGGLGHSHTLVVSAYDFLYLRAGVERTIESSTTEEHLHPCTITCTEK